MSETLTSCCNPNLPHQTPNMLPCRDVYVVEAGDTLYMIAQRYDIPVSLLMRANRVLNPYNLKIGQRICIPFWDREPREDACDDPAPAQPEMTRPAPQETPTPSEPEAPSAPESRPTPSQPAVPQNTAPSPTAPMQCADTHTVAAGDTLYMIAKQYQITLDALMRANPSLNPYNLRIGTRLCIPSCK